MRGYVVVSQWHSKIKHIDELLDPAKHTGDARTIDQVCGFYPPDILDIQPECHIGECVMRVEDDGSLTLVLAQYDTSD